MKFTMKEQTDRLIDRFVRATAQGGALDLDDAGSDSIASIACDFRLHKARARDILLRLAPLARRHADVYPSLTAQMQELQPDNPNAKGLDVKALEREFKEIEAEALRLIRG